MTIKIIDETTDFKELPCRPLTKRQLIEKLEELECPDDLIVVFDDGLFHGGIENIIVTDKNIILE